MYPWNVPQLKRQTLTLLTMTALMLAIGTDANSQDKDNLLMLAAMVGLYKANCGRPPPDAAWEAANVVVKIYGQQQVVERMFEMDLKRERIGNAAFCAAVEKEFSKAQPKR
jgi:hypothetical protein